LLVEDRGDRIDRENKVGRFDHHQRDRQRREHERIGSGGFFDLFDSAVFDHHARARHVRVRRDRRLV
jgi:hypothetical protein